MEETSDRKAGTARGIRNGWFSEDEAMWPGQKFSLALEVRPVHRRVVERKDLQIQSDKTNERSSSLSQPRE